MVAYTRFLLLFVAVSIAAPIAFGQDQDLPAKPQAKVELRWVERTHVEGLTEAKGYLKGYDPEKDTVYPHLKAALVLTSAEVAEARLITQDSTRAGLGVNYMVELHLTPEARKQLADSYEGNEMRLLTVIVDGNSRGLYRYEKDSKKEFVPEQARAETFAPSVGYFSSKFEAQRLVDAFK